MATRRGNTTHDSLSGTGLADLLIGNAGNARLHGGRGNDRPDGGAGAGSDITLDLGGLAGQVLHTLEVIDLNGSGASTLKRGAADVLDLNPAGLLTIAGGADDAVHSPIDVWSLDSAAATVIGGQTYDRWVLGEATLLIDSDIAPNNLTSGDDGSVFAPVDSPLMFFSTFSSMSLSFSIGAASLLDPLPLGDPNPIV